ncbi:50S ribosomal protein L29 [Prosthecochloris sp. N3]|uniref:Large ribosomal subunit protein uL29 n=1 Tax=Prosthecochloris ethylica TaxID=2743976 RepID=A0ABR9XP72_9CHLB|nr:MULTISPECIES: 50S ribosomal protein L29 [Prosthecochloris]MEC9486441.1 50S ribosomal protein L29 [Prosthecochloris sp.]MBF0585859.1 50S ribosomal protein L29 [Prosthecochloris ethylica]MBF0635769.1 50S ribosomal protein L29 [Prosthecochloris ethylica]NUK47067.1 50S ribosomal protein L29 [Prosthecochloris ethylica]RNA65545.1 50S ribosomal protein L29 [Prosthecochloris sp. ZM_2]
MKQHEIAALSKDELIANIRELEDRLADMNFYKVIEPPQNPMVFRNSRRDIARMKTRLRMIEQEEAASS